MLRNHCSTRVTTIAGAAATAVLLAACGHAAQSATVPTLSHAGTTTAASGSSRAQALHAAAQCIRDHGIPNFSDPTVSPDGQVYTDQRPVQDYEQNNGTPRDQPPAPVAACQSLITAADWDPSQEPPAPPALVAAGVRAAQCLRANGLPNYRDPTAETPYVPGHGFSISGDEMPAGGKADPVAQRALQACRPILDAEIDASSLANLPKR
jgi:hypothetical protein